MWDLDLCIPCLNFPKSPHQVTTVLRCACVSVPIFCSLFVNTWCEILGHTCLFVHMPIKRCFHSKVLWLYSLVCFFQSLKILKTNLASPHVSSWVCDEEIFIPYGICKCVTRHLDDWENVQVLKHCVEWMDKSGNGTCFHSGAGGMCVCVCNRESERDSLYPCKLQGLWSSPQSMTPYSLLIRTLQLKPSTCNYHYEKKNQTTCFSNNNLRKRLERLYL